jgi:hypothetical protein
MSSRAAQTAKDLAAAFDASHHRFAFHEDLAFDVAAPDLSNS